MMKLTTTTKVLLGVAGAAGIFLLVTTPEQRAGWFMDPLPSSPQPPRPIPIPQNIEPVGLAIGSRVQIRETARAPRSQVEIISRVLSVPTPFLPRLWVYTGHVLDRVFADDITFFDADVERPVF